MNFREKTVLKRYLYRGKILNLRCDDVTLPNGKASVREIVEHHGGAAVVAETERGVALVRQFRYAYGEEIYEIPAGKLNEGEDPMTAAARELSEETGLVAEKLRLLTVLYPSPGYTDEKIYIYLAEKIKRGEAHLDEGEFLDCIYMPVEELLDRILSGEVRDAKTVAGVFMAFCSAKTE